MKNKQIRLILHLGQHKTGSKALQSYLWLNQQRFIERGILYPTVPKHKINVPAYQCSHFILYALARRDAMIASGEVSAAENFYSQYKDQFAPFKNLQDLLQEIEQEREKHNAHTIILSSEDLFDMQSAHELDFHSEWIVYLAKKLAELSLKLNWRIDAVVYLRRPDHLLHAHYAQFIKGSVCNHLSFDMFANLFKPRLNSLAILEIWATHLQAEKIHVRPYEFEFMRNGIVGDFCQSLLGFIPTDSCAKVEHNLEYANQTPSKPYIDLIRLINRVFSHQSSNLIRNFVLKLAFHNQSKFDYRKAWLSPRARNEILKSYRQDFNQIAKIYIGTDNEKFFQEDWN